MVPRFLSKVIHTPASQHEKPVYDTEQKRLDVLNKTVCIQSDFPLNFCSLRGCISIYPTEPLPLHAAS